MNTLTMLALSLVVGMLVDDAIVEVENIVRHLRMGKPPLQAATDAAIEIGLAVVATTFTLCAVFVPVAFMDGIPGQFFKPFAFTATIAVLFSLLVARMLTPMMASKYMRPYHEPEKAGRVKNWYLDKVQWALAHRWITMGAVTVLMIGTLMIARQLPTGLRPAADNGFINLNVSLPPGSRLEDTRQAVEQVRLKLKDRKEIDRIWAVVNVRSANIGVVLVDRKDRELSQQVLQRQFLAIARSIPGCTHPGGGNNFGGGAMQVELTGDDSNLLTAAAAQVEREMRGSARFLECQHQRQPAAAGAGHPAAAGPRSRAGRDDGGHQPGDAHRHQRRCHQQPGQDEPAGPADPDPRAAE